MRRGAAPLRARRRCHHRQLTRSLQHLHSVTASGVMADVSVSEQEVVCLPVPPAETRSLSRGSSRRITWTCGASASSSAATATWQRTRFNRRGRSPGGSSPRSVSRIGSDLGLWLSRQRDSSAPPPPPPPVELEPGWHAALSTAPEPDARHIDLGRALAHLSTEERTRLAMRYVAGLNASEISASPADLRPPSEADWRASSRAFETELTDV